MLKIGLKITPMELISPELGWIMANEAETLAYNVSLRKEFISGFLGKSADSHFQVSLVSQAKVLKVIEYCLRISLSMASYDALNPL